jgi:2-polyprenyl-3-methyl-5-hydroxy-6-metoxy-1,4-benzoquinol methylase
MGYPIAELNQRHETETRDGFAAVPSLGESNARLNVTDEGWTRLDACPVCKRTAIVPLATLRHMPYDRCGDCGFVFTNPQAPDSVRTDFYDSAFYTNYRHFEDLRRQDDPFFSISMYTDPRRLARQVADAEPESVLDFGCGTGTFLALLRDEFGVAGVDGLEISEEARRLAERAYGLEIAATPEELPRSRYDFALLLEVIEHVPDPHAIIAELSDLVRPGGLVLITTPAVDNLLGRHLPSQCAHYTAPSHISMFTEASMERLLEGHSMRVARLDTDSESGVAGAFVRSLLYSIDYLSPTGPDDADDLLYRPTRLGRSLGRGDTRRPLHRSVAGKVAGTVDKVLDHISGRPNHLYVLAERI